MQHHTSAPGDHESEWQAHNLVRIGLPPLRFQGHRLDWREAVAGDARLFIGLILRKSGGYSVEISRLSDCGVWVPHAVTSPSIEAAMTAVEAYCTDIMEEIALSAPSPSAGIDSLMVEMVRKGRLADEVGRFQRLVGQALDRWMQLATSDRTVSGAKPC